ncbi:MAG: DUF547 domain-containing protein [Planctomycetes bacterium]|nr:DUF547 domain-containing protein [Planctomycetota bacterium]
MNRRLGLLIVVVTLALGCKGGEENVPAPKSKSPSAKPKAPAPKAPVAKTPTASDPGTKLPSQSTSTTATSDSLHAPFSALLQRYVNSRNEVDYAGWKANDEQALKKYVAALAAVDPAGLGNQAERMAYWINAYNAVTLKAMLEFHPIQSIKDKVSESFNVWDDYGFGPKKLSLNTIEHKLLRPMGDPRIHAAVNCASTGCPPLRAEAYLASTLDAQLTDNTRTWLRDTTRGVRLSGVTVAVSKIFEWYGADFGADHQARLNWIAGYVGPSLARKLRSGGLRFETLDYGWALNKQ